MKKLLLTLLVVGMSYTSTNAQTIGDHLNTLMELKPGGDLSEIAGVQCYTHVDEQGVNIMIYFFNENLIIDRVIVRPRLEGGVQDWLRIMNRSWVKQDSTTWLFFKDDGSILQSEMKYLDQVGFVFVITEYFREN